eukprot:213761-Chlamydomonas_euryale.AAC.1
MHAPSTLREHSFIRSWRAPPGAWPGPSFVAPSATAPAAAAAQQTPTPQTPPHATSESQEAQTSCNKPTGAVKRHLARQGRARKVPWEHCQGK